MEKRSQWKEGLSLLYYEGYTDNLQQTLTKHSAATVTTYGVRRSHTCINRVTKTADDEIEKENVDTNETQILKVSK